MRKNAYGGSDVFRSAIGGVIYASLTAAIALFFAFLAAGYVFGIAYLVAFGSFVFPPLAAAILWLCYRTKYIITDEELIIRFPGSPDERIPLSGVVSLRKVKDNAAAKALSTDRVEITIGYGTTVQISPADPDRFIQIVENSKNVGLKSV